MIATYDAPPEVRHRSVDLITGRVRLVIVSTRTSRMRARRTSTLVGRTLWKRSLEQQRTFDDPKTVCTVGEEDARS